MNVYHGMTRERLDELLEKIRGVRVALLGDLCLDVYWLADMRKSELSRETPHFPLPIVEERMSPGGGGNVAANLAALGPTQVYAVGSTGTDWRGDALRRLLDDMGVDTTHTVYLPGVLTNAYCKPLRMGISNLVYEDPRLDFAGDEPLSAEAEDAVIASLDKLAPNIEVLCVSDQLHYGIVTKRVREHVMKLAQNGLTVIVDSRDRIGMYQGVILKPNEVEGAKAAGIDEANCIKDYVNAALVLARKQDSEVLMTIGALGSLYAAKENVTYIPAHDIAGPIDIVGAGDTFLSGFSLAVATGASKAEAAFFATLCSEITIQKIGTTGVATTKEIVKWFEEA